MTFTWNSVYRLQTEQWELCGLIPKAKLLFGVPSTVLLLGRAAPRCSQEGRDICLCGFLQQLDASLLGNLKEGQGRAAALLFSPLSKQRCSLASGCASRQRSTRLSPQYPVEMDMGALEWPKEAGSFEYFVPSGSTKFGATLEYSFAHQEVHRQIETGDVWITYWWSIGSSDFSAGKPPVRT